MTAGTHRSVRPWRAEVAEVTGSLRLAVAALCARLRATMTPAPRIADSAGQAQDPAPSPTPGQDEAASSPDAADTVPLRAVSPVTPQGHPYAGWPLYGIPAIDYPRADGVIHVSEHGHLTIESRGNWKETRGFLAIVDGPVVPRWYRAWLAAHPEAEVAA